MEELTYLRHLAAALLARLRSDERGVLSTEGVIVIAALVILAGTVSAVIASKVIAKANSIQP
jgi:hypothetical protein